MTPTPSPEPNMTAEELLSLLEIWRDKPAEKQMWLANITAFGDRRFEEGQNQKYVEVLTKWAEANKDAVTNACREAIEKCAKIAEYYPMKAGLSEGAWATPVVCQRIAKEIRAILDESGRDGKEKV